jgi:chromosome segregation ATPase
MDEGTGIKKTARNVNEPNPQTLGEKMKTLISWLLVLAIAIGSGLGIGGCYRYNDDSAYAEYQKREHRFERWYGAERLKTEKALEAKEVAERDMHNLKKAKDDAERSVKTEAKRYETYREQCDTHVQEWRMHKEEAEKRKEAAERSLRDERTESARLRKEAEIAKEEARKVKEESAQLLQHIVDAGEKARKLQGK